MLLHSPHSMLVFCSSSFQVLVATISSFPTAQAALLVPCSILCTIFMRSLLLYLSSNILHHSFLSLVLPLISLPFFSMSFSWHSSCWSLALEYLLKPSFQTSLFSSHRPLPIDSHLPPLPPFQPHTTHSCPEFLLAKKWCSFLGNSLPLNNNK